MESINYEQIVTGDIVQSLPKIEEILNKKPQNPALLSETPGVVKSINNSNLEKLSTITLLANTTKIDKNTKTEQKSTISYTLNRKKTNKAIIVKKNDYVYVGYPLTEGSEIHIIY